jgi:hypothetical protein
VRFCACGRSVSQPWKMQPPEKLSIKRRGIPLICGAREGNCRSLRYATPDFLSRLVALANFMLLSLMKAAHAVAACAAWQEIRVRFGRDDKGKGGFTFQGWLVGWEECKNSAQILLQSAR